MDNCNKPNNIPRKIILEDAERRHQEQMKVALDAERRNDAALKTIQLTMETMQSRHQVAMEAIAKSSSRSN